MRGHANSQNFVGLAVREQERFRFVDALGEADAVTERLLAAVEGL